MRYSSSYNVNDSIAIKCNILCGEKATVVVSLDVKLSLSFESYINNKGSSPVCHSKEKLNQIDAQRERNWNINGSRKLVFCRTEGSNFTVQHVYFPPLFMQLSTFLFFFLFLKYE